MNKRRQTNTLGNIDIKRLDQARKTASDIGLPLNCFTSFNPIRGGGSGTISADLFGKVRNWIKVWLRRRDVEPTLIWTAENSSDGGCPHVHLLIHVPAKIRSDFREAFARNYPGQDGGGTITDVRADHGEAHLHRRSGRIGSTFNYMTKQMDAQARYARRHRVTAAAPGPFTGKRFGMSANIFVGEIEILEAKAASLAQRAAA